MLIVDINTLCTICKLNFLNKVVINSLFTENCKNIVRINSTESKLSTLSNMSTLYDIFAKSCTVRNKILFLLSSILIINDNVTALFDFLKTNISFDFRKDSKLLWSTCDCRARSSTRAVSSSWRSSSKLASCVEMRSAKPEANAVWRISMLLRRG